jgi:hypothetical protein
MEMKDRKAVAGEKIIHRETLKQNLEEKKEQLVEVEQILTAATHETPQIENELKSLEMERKRAKDSLNAFERDYNAQIEDMNSAIRQVGEYKAANERDKLSNASLENFREKVKFRRNILLVLEYFLQMDEQKNLIDELSEKRRQRENQLSGTENQRNQLRMLNEQLRRMDILNEVKTLL